MASPLSQFEINKIIPFEIFGYDISFYEFLISDVSNSSANTAFSFYWFEKIPL